MNVSFNGCGTEIATFMTDNKIEKGKFVAISENGKVASNISSGDFLGCVISSDESYAAVCYRGIITAENSSAEISLGKNIVSIGAEGELEVSDEGRPIYVISIDEEAKTITFIF